MIEQYVWLGFAIWGTISLMHSLLTGEIRSRGGSSSREEDPEDFWISFALYAAAVLILGWGGAWYQFTHR